MSSFVTPAGAEAIGAPEQSEVAAFGTLTTQVERPATGQGSPSALQLLVVEESGLSSYPLPESGKLSIGRAEDCDVRLRDPLASRHHASLHVQPLGIEDGESANGTHVGNALLAARTVRPLRPGEAISIGHSLLLVQRVAPDRTVHGAKTRGVSETGTEHDSGVIIEDPVMMQLYTTVDRISQVSINVLILGETGSGKDMVAEAIHRRSPRHEAPLVHINCAALSESLLESELFGHERGAFTGAVSTKPGLIEAADRGTVFLDEVGELTPLLQAKLLRVIEAREVLRVGSVHARPVDVRFVSATNRNLASEVSRGAFRADLFFRLNGVCLQVPPLRDRPREILPLADAFLSRAAERIGARTPLRLTPEAIKKLLAHAWPGNVRELRNEMERAAVLSSGPRIGPLDLCLSPLSLPGQSMQAHPRVDTFRPPDASDTESLPPSFDAADAYDAAGEQGRIVEALAQCSGNQTRAAKVLGMPRRTFVDKLRLYNIPRPRKP
jgi:two-component system, NtrC family, response regulator AtoC